MEGSRSSPLPQRDACTPACICSRTGHFSRRELWHSSPGRMSHFCCLPTHQFCMCLLLPSLPSRHDFCHALSCLPLASTPYLPLPCLPPPSACLTHTFPSPTFPYLLPQDMFLYVWCGGCFACGLLCWWYMRHYAARALLTRARLRFHPSSQHPTTTLPYLPALRFPSFYSADIYLPFPNMRHYIYRTGTGMA